SILEAASGDLGRSPDHLNKLRERRAAQRQQLTSLDQAIERLEAAAQLRARIGAHRRHHPDTVPYQLLEPSGEGESVDVGARGIKQVFKLVDHQQTKLPALAAN